MQVKNLFIIIWTENQIPFYTWTRKYFCNFNIDWIFLEWNCCVNWGETGLLLCSELRSCPPFRNRSLKTAHPYYFKCLLCQLLADNTFASMLILPEVLASDCFITVPLHSHIKIYEMLQLISFQFSLYYRRHYVDWLYTQVHTHRINRLYFY